MLLINLILKCYAENIILTSDFMVTCEKTNDAFFRETNFFVTLSRAVR